VLYWFAADTPTASANIRLCCERCRTWAGRTAFASPARKQVDALDVLPDLVLQPVRAQAALAARHALPAIYFANGFAYSRRAD
jgi:hypothetical protein